MEYDQQVYELEGAWFWSAYPGPRIRMQVTEKGGQWDHRYIAFSGHRAVEWFAQGLLPPRPIELPQSGCDFVDLFDQLLSHHASDAAWSDALVANLLERILLELAQGRNIDGQTLRPWLKQVLDYLKTVDGSPDYEAIASSVNMSLRSLRHQFKKATGVAIHTYYLQERINQAKQALTHADTPIKKIADQLGYQDVFFFSKQFKRYSGFTPAAYRHSRF